MAKSPGSHSTGASTGQGGTTLVASPVVRPSVMEGTTQVVVPAVIKNTPGKSYLQMIFSSKSQTLSKRFSMMAKALLAAKSVKSQYGRQMR